jgi:hypothetical protein
VYVLMGPGMREGVGAEDIRCFSGNFDIKRLRQIDPPGGSHKHSCSSFFGTKVKRHEMSPLSLRCRQAAHPNTHCYLGCCF